MYRLKKIQILWALVLLHTGAFSQSPQGCPQNIDFEEGDFTNWVCDVHSRNSNQWNGGSSAVPGQHAIVPSSNTTLDQYGSFPISCPNGSGYSVKLGNNLDGLGDQGRDAQKITYTYTIPASAPSFSILYYYAVVLEEPLGNPHTSEQKPRFFATVYNVTDNDTIDCVTADFVAGALPGFLPSTSSPAGSQVWYKGWTPVSMNLDTYRGKTIRLEFITYDCTLGSHFGYAYVDVGSACNGTILGTTVCTGDTSLTLTAPYGYQNYAWYSSPAFSTVISTQQVLTLNPPPVSSVTYPVIVTPFPNYGCIDTIYANIVVGTRPPAFAGNDATVCRWQPVPLGGPPNPLHTYSWSPKTLVSDSTISNPIGILNTYDTGRIILTVAEASSGCARKDTVLLIPIKVDTSVQLTGPSTYCTNGVFNSTLTLSNAVSNIQWYNGTTSIAGATGYSYAPASTGTYWAHVSQNGCTDSTRQIIFKVSPLPVVSFSISKDSGCVTKNSFTFINNSSVTPNEPLTYLWGFGDGTTSTDSSPVKSYSRKGVYNIRLDAVSASGCKASGNHPVTILPNVSADFTWDSLCLNKPSLFKNTSNENGSAFVNYTWDFGNGITSGIKNPLPFNYITSGSKKVLLTATAPGCENDVQTVEKNVLVNTIAAAIKYPPVLVPFGYSKQVWARNHVGTTFTWQPAQYLSNSNVQAPYVTGVNDIVYRITLTNEHACQTSDTLEVKVLKKAGWYIPNAFTPNGDLLNDDIRPYIIGMKSFTRFSIYNRAGQRVFSTNNNGEGWDGTFKGEKLGTQSFAWVLEFVDGAGKKVLEKGTLMLVR